MEKINDKEWVARVLQPLQYKNGRISKEAFRLRERIKEDYISVLREDAFSFMEDLTKVCHKSKDCHYASLNVGGIKALQFETLKPNEVRFEVNVVDNANLKSHAGIFTKVNGEYVKGGEPLRSLKAETGISQSVVELLLKSELAKLAEKHITHLLQDADDCAYANEDIPAI